VRRLPTVLVLLLTAVALLPAAPAQASARGRLLGHDRARGSASAVDIGWGASVRRSVRAPRSFTVVVRAALRPGFLCSYAECEDIQVQWDLACSKPGRRSSRQGGMTGRPPKVGHPRLPFRGPRTCTISARALPMAYVGGWIEMWVYARR
jgi:hypothetical protein